jgi:hypothetical protein
MTDTPSGTSSSETLSNAQVQAIAVAVGAAVTTSLNEITAKLNSLEQIVESRIKNTTTNDDTNFEASVTGAYDMFDDLRRANVSRDRIAVYAEQALANAIEIAHGVGMRSLDHFCAVNPEVSPRTARPAA